jgi:hypothetical protein
LILLVQIEHTASNYSKDQKNNKDDEACSGSFGLLVVVRVLWTLRVEVYVVTVETYHVVCEIVNLIISIEEDSAKDVFILQLWNIVTLNKDDAVIYLFT